MYLMFNRKNLRIMKGLVYQTPLFQLVINFIMAILETAGVLERVVSILKYIFFYLTQTIRQFNWNLRNDFFLFLKLDSKYCFRCPRSNQHNIFYHRNVWLQCPNYWLVLIKKRKFLSRKLSKVLHFNLSKYRICSALGMEKLFGK